MYERENFYHGFFLTILGFPRKPSVLFSSLFQHGIPWWQNHENESKQDLSPRRWSPTITGSTVQEAVDHYIRSLSPSAAAFLHNLAPPTRFMAAATSATQNPSATVAYIHSIAPSMGSVAAATPAVQTTAVAVGSSNQAPMRSGPFVVASSLAPSSPTSPMPIPCLRPPLLPLDWLVFLRLWSNNNLQTSMRASNNKLLLGAGTGPSTNLDQSAVNASNCIPNLNHCTLFVWTNGNPTAPYLSGPMGTPPANCWWKVEWLEFGLLKWCLRDVTNSDI